MYRFALLVCYWLSISASNNLWSVDAFSNKNNNNVRIQTCLQMPVFQSSSRIDPLRPSPIRLYMSDSVKTVDKQEQQTRQPAQDPKSITVQEQRRKSPLLFQTNTQIPVMDTLSSIIVGNDNNSEYRRGLIIIGFITLLFSSNSPVLHAAFTNAATAVPPVLLLNAAVSVVALVGLVLGGDTLESNTSIPSSIKKKVNSEEQDENRFALQGGLELGIWKFLGTTANLYGLALTTAGHGALLIQLTTLIVPFVQGLQGVPIPPRIQFSVILALLGVICFTQDPTGTSPSIEGDALCVVAAIFYATYDLRLFEWGKRIPAKRLITSKIGTQAILSVILLGVLGRQETLVYISHADITTWSSIIPVIVWSGVAVNAIAPFLQVGGQQVVGPTRCQTIYASQPLWAAILSFLFLNETIGIQGFIGGSIFLMALFLAATSDAPDPNCGETNCEI